MPVGPKRQVFLMRVGLQRLQRDQEGQWACSSALKMERRASVKTKKKKKKMKTTKGTKMMKRKRRKKRRSGRGSWRRWRKSYQSQ